VLQIISEVLTMVAMVLFAPLVVAQILLWTIFG
jgi:hypothetical protein